MVWSKDPEDETKEKPLEVSARVITDPDRELRLVQIYKALEQEIHKHFPDSMIRLDIVGDKVAVSGEAQNVKQATDILRIVRGNIPNDTQRLTINDLAMDVDEIEKWFLENRCGDIANAGGPNVINRIRVRSEDQVLLKVHVVEVNRTAARTIGLKLDAGMVGPNGVLLIEEKKTLEALVTLKELGYAKFLASPNLITLNGQTASFHVGGQIPVPVVLSGAQVPGEQPQTVARPAPDHAPNRLLPANSDTGVRYVPHGLYVKCTPTLVDCERIRLQLDVNISQIEPGLGINCRDGIIPGLSERNANTEIEMRLGQTVVLTSLGHGNLAAKSKRPTLGCDHPIFSRCTGSDEKPAGDCALVVLVTPDIIKPACQAEPGFRGAGCEMRTPDFMKPACRAVPVAAAPCRDAASGGKCRVEPRDAPLNLADVAALASSGVSDAIIINQMHTTGARFKLCAEDILFLKKNNVSDCVVIEMQKSAGIGRNRSACPCPCPSTTTRCPCRMRI